MIQGLILKLLQAIESRYSGHIPFAYRDAQIKCWIVAIDDYDLYTFDKEYKELCNQYRERAKLLYNEKLVFVYQFSSELLLANLIEKDLILNIEG